MLSWAEDYKVGINIEPHGPYTTDPDMLEKIFSFFKHVGREDMILDPYADDFAPVEEKIDWAFANRDEISSGLSEQLVRLRKHMTDSMDQAQVL